MSVITLCWLPPAQAAAPASADSVTAPAKKSASASKKKKPKTLEQSLIAAAPRANPRVIRLALKAVTCAELSDESAGRATRLAVIDYSQPSSKRRLWVFDLDRRKLLFEEWVAHGRNSGENYARKFSNVVDSLTSSIGLFRTGETYDGSNGYSMRMAGLEHGINDRAEERALVMHAAPYVDTKLIKTQGRIGRSLGCPALRPTVGRPIIDTLKDGQYLFSYYPDNKWLASSEFLNCGKGKPGAGDGSSTGRISTRS